MLLALLWILLLVSAGLWLAAHQRLRFIDRMFPPLDADTALPVPLAWPKISVMVPARNEENDVGMCLASLATQDYPEMELIVVDDESTDATLDRAREALKGMPSARIVEGRPRPGPGWIGKSWALTQGAEQATGKWLLFIDADVYHHPAAIRQAMALAMDRGMDAVSIMPRIDCPSFWEKCVMPLFAALTVLVEPLDRANHPEAGGSRLSGAFILVRRSVYEAVGGHAAVSSQILEDMALARRLKQHGARTWLTFTHDLTHTRMYHNFHELWRGLVRLSFPMLDDSLARLGLAYLASLMFTVAPWLTLGAGAWLGLQGAREMLPLALASLLLCAYQAYVLRDFFRVLRVHNAYAWLLALAAGLYCFAATWAAWLYFTGRGLDWKQRRYRPAEARPHDLHAPR